MTALYVARIIREAGQPGAFTLENVPHLWYENTKAELAKRGLDGYGQPLAPEV